MTQKIANKIRGDPTRRILPECISNPVSITLSHAVATHAASLGGLNCRLQIVWAMGELCLEKPVRNT